MHSKLSTVEIQPKSSHHYSIIWLHGLGADGHDFEGIVPELRLTAEAHTHFIFPEAPVRPITINGGMKMRAWFDILEMSPEIKVDTAALYHSAELINGIIRLEIEKDIPAENIMLAGFSQGGAVALHAGLRFPEKLAGIIALSTTLPTIEKLKTERRPANDLTPILMAHGIIDSVIAVESGLSTYEKLKSMNYDIEWHDYVMDHSICADEIERIADFVNSIFQ
ncbi:MAG: alpha/beta hydrolase [Gammaproteobacteria bacterium]